MSFSLDKCSPKLVSPLNETLQSNALPFFFVSTEEDRESIFVFNSCLNPLTARTRVSIFRCRLALHSKSTVSMNWKSNKAEFRSFEGTCSILARRTWKNDVTISSDLWQRKLPEKRNFFSALYNVGFELFAPKQC